MAAGAAVASANNASAYNAGVAAGVSAASAPIAAPAGYPVGYNYASLPPGCLASQRAWHGLLSEWQHLDQPFFGANGAYYQVVPAP